MTHLIPALLAAPAAALGVVADGALEEDPTCGQGSGPTPGQLLVALLLTHDGCQSAAPFSVAWNDRGDAVKDGVVLGILNSCQLWPRLYVTQCDSARVRMKAWESEVRLASSASVKSPLSAHGFYSKGGADARRCCRSGARSAGSRHRRAHRR